MKFSCKTCIFQRGISVVQNVAQSKIANPIVENILVIAEEGRVLFLGTNLAQTIQCTIEAEVERDGQIAVPGKYIGSLARELGEDELKIELKRNSLHLSCGKGKYRLGGIPADEFPPFLPVSGGQSVVFSTAELKEVIRRVRGGESPVEKVGQVIPVAVVFGVIQIRQLSGSPGGRNMFHIACDQQEKRCRIFRGG